LESELMVQLDFYFTTNPTVGSLRTAEGLANRTGAAVRGIRIACPSTSLQPELSISGLSRENTEIPRS
jgi:hypothetical protein